MCVYVGVALSVCEHAESVCLCAGECVSECHCDPQVELRGPMHSLMDRVASRPPPGHPPYCRTGSCSGGYAPPVYPHGEPPHCLGNPELPTHTHNVLFNEFQTKPHHPQQCSPVFIPNDRY